MKSIIPPVCLFVLLTALPECWGTDYTGIWKGACTDNFGVQIKPDGNQLYSISFCGPGGCFEPGEWTPNTLIEGDPKYKIFSPTEMGIKREDASDYFIYKKCTSAPDWEIVEMETGEPKKLPDCVFDTASKEQGVLIAWVTDVRETTQFGRGIKTLTTVVGPFRPIALLTGTTLKESLGAGIHRGQPFWYVLSPESKPIKLSSAGSFFDLMNEGQCVYFGSFENDKPPRWTLLSSKPLPSVFRSPTLDETKEFYRLNSTCVVQGDYPEGQEPPCVRPAVIAVTDFNKNGIPEYWATEPYLWDTGLTVWENIKGSLTPLLQVCVGCSD